MLLPEYFSAHGFTTEYAARKFKAHCKLAIGSDMLVVIIIVTIIIVLSPRVGFAPLSSCQRSCRSSSVLTFLYMYPLII